MAELANWYPVGTRLRTRKPVTQVTSTPYGEQLTSVWSLREATGDWAIIVGALTGLACLDVDQLVPIPISSGPTILPSSAAPWDFHQYVNIGYAMREGVGLKRFLSDHMEEAGIDAPLVAPTVVQGGAGDIEAGDYYPVFTYCNSLTGAESNPSPVGAKVVLAVDKQANWSAIGTSNNGQVNARRLYWTLPNQRGEFFFVAQLNDNFTTAYVSNVVLNDLGRPVSWDNAMPPDSLRFGDFFMERLFATDGTRVLFSERNLPESFAEDNIIEIFTDDGHEIRGIKAFGSICVVGKTNKVHYLLNTGPRKFERYTLSDRHGVWSHASMKVAEGWLYWYGGDNVYRTDGTNVEGLGSYAVKELLASVPDNQKEHVSAVVYAAPPLNWYMLSLPQNTSGTDRVVVVLNYKTMAWTVFDHKDLVSGYTAPTFIGELFDEDYGQQLYSVFDDANHLYRYHDESTTVLEDRGLAIDFRLKTKSFGLEHKGLLKALRRVWLLSTSCSRDVTLSLYRDGSRGVTKSRTVSLDQGRDWKLYNLNASRALGATLQLGLVYSGNVEVDLDGISLDVMEFFRTMRAA